MPTIIKTTPLAEVPFDVSKSASSFKTLCEDWQGQRKVTLYGSGALDLTGLTADIEISEDNFQLDAQGHELDFGDFGFSYVKAGLIRKGLFADVNFVGSATAKSCIKTTGMGPYSGVTNNRVYDISFERCMFQEFIQADYPAMELTACDEWKFNDCTFAHPDVTAPFIRMSAGIAGKVTAGDEGDHYGVANFKFRNPEIFLTNNAATDQGAFIDLASNLTGGESIGAFELNGGHVVSFGAVDQAAITVSDSTNAIDGLDIHDLRVESCRLIDGNKVRKSNFHDLNVINAKANTITIDLDVASTNNKIHHNYFEIPSGTGLCLVDANTSATQPNEFTENTVATGSLTFLNVTRVQGNWGLNPLGYIAANIFTTVATSKISAGKGNAATPTASTDYNVFNSDVIITAANSANANNAIMLKDPAGNNCWGAAKSTLDNEFIPRKYKLNWGAFTGAAGAVTTYWL